MYPTRVEKVSPRPDIVPVPPVPLLTRVEREVERERREDTRKRRRRVPKAPPPAPGHVDQLA